MFVGLYAVIVSAIEDNESVFTRQLVTFCPFTKNISSSVASMMQLTVVGELPHSIFMYGVCAVCYHDPV